MKHEQRNTLLLALLAVLSIGLTLAVQLHQYELSRQGVYGEAVDIAVRELRLERARLQEEMTELKQQADRERLGDGVVSLVFTQLDERIYTEIFPLMQEKKLPGVLALSDTQFPGEENCLSREQTQELLDAGWSLCVQWDNWTELEEYLPRVKALLADAEWPMPQTIYLAPNRYRRELDEALEQAGFRIVICHGEDETETLNRKDEDVLWHLVSLSWNRAGIKKVVNKASGFGGAFAMNIDFGDRRSGYNRDIFPVTVDTLDRLPNFQVMTPEMARGYRSTVASNEALDAQIQWYQGEIAEINREIEKIYREN